MTKPRIRVTTEGKISGAVIDGEVMRPAVKGSYMKGGASPFFFSWNPALRDSREDVRDAYLPAVARAIDALQNGGWIVGAVDQSIATCLGAGLRLAARPDKKALNWDDKKAQDWADIVERRWVSWSENPMECDAAGKQDMGQLMDSAMRFFFSHGEAIALLPYIRRPYSTPGTKVQMLPPHRLVQDSNIAARKFQGVTMDTFGMPTAYTVQKDSATLASRADIRARDGAGRPQIAHLMDSIAGSVRGITPLAPVLQTVRQYDQLSDATLKAALIQAIFAGTITGDTPTPEMLNALQTQEEQADSEAIGVNPMENLLGMQAEFYKGTRLDFGENGRLVHLFPGQQMQFLRSETPNRTYEPFAKFLLREIARCVGTTYEALTGDYSGATYSSVRMATAEVWPLVMRRRKAIPARLAQCVYEAWLEEEIEEGRIEFDDGIYGFLRNRAAAVAADWRGPAKPQADDLKTAKAHEIYLSTGISSRERVCDDLGYDYGDEAERMAREKEIRSALGLPEMEPVKADPLADALAQDDPPANQGAK